MTSKTYQRGQTGQNAPRTLEQFDHLLTKYAYKFYARAQGLSAMMDVEDIKQELSLIFLRCVESYDETKGGSFMNFLISAMYHEMNRIFSKDQRNREIGVTTPQHVASDDGEELSIFDIIDSGVPSPEQTLEAGQCYADLVESLSPQARLLVEQLVNPSEVVCEQFDLQLRGAHGLRDRGYTDARAMLSMNMRFLSLLFGIPRKTMRELQDEIRRKAAFSFALEGQS